MTNTPTSGDGTFDAAAEGYDLDERHVAVAEALVAGLRLPSPPDLVVDVATGTGVAAFCALRRLAPVRVVAVDVAPRMLDQARAKAAAHDPGGRVEWRLAPAVPLPVADGSADVVLCASSLHFLGRAAVPDWQRVLRGGGQLAFSPAARRRLRPGTGIPPASRCRRRATPRPLGRGADRARCRLPAGDRAAHGRRLGASSPPDVPHMGRSALTTCPTPAVFAAAVRGKPGAEPPAQEVSDGGSAHAPARPAAIREPGAGSGR